MAAGAITAIVITGGIASVAVIALGIASTATGLGSGIFRHFAHKKSEKEIADKIKDFEIAKNNEELDFTDFEEHLMGIEDSETFEFEFNLTNNKQTCSGNGKLQFEKIVNRILPQLDKIDIEDPQAKKAFASLLCINLHRGVNSKSGLSRGFMEVLKAALATAGYFCNKFAEEIASIAIKNAPKIAGSFGVAFSGFVACLDLYQIYKDCNQKSFADVINILAHEICTHPLKAIKTSIM